MTDIKDALWAEKSAAPKWLHLTTPGLCNPQALPAGGLIPTAGVKTKGDTDALIEVWQ